MVPDTELRGSLGGGELLGTAAVGAVTFPTLLAVAQTAVFKSLRITVASRLSPLFGVASVSAAGFAASLAAIKTCSLIQIRLQTLRQLQIRGEYVLKTAQRGLKAYVRVPAQVRFK